MQIKVTILVKNAGKTAVEWQHPETDAFDATWVADKDVTFVESGSGYEPAVAMAVLEAGRAYGEDWGANLVSHINLDELAGSVSHSLRGKSRLYTVEQLKAQGQEGVRAALASALNLTGESLTKKAPANAKPSQPSK